MPAKNKSAHVFKVGDPARVRDVPFGKIVNSGVIVKVTATRVVFEGPTSAPERPRRWWVYKRKGTRWVEQKKDHFELEP